MIVQRASLALDIAPEEFESLEPRLRDGKPYLQIADSLVNGAGFCRRLAGPGKSAEPLVVDLIRSMLDDPNDPMTGAFFDQAHLKECSRACYRCIQRYGNRGYHGLLDWRLGLCFLRALIEPNYRVGLDNRFNEYPELKDWPSQARAAADSIQLLNPMHSSIVTAGDLQLPVVVDRGSSSHIAFIVVHPFWDLVHPAKELSEVISDLDPTLTVCFVDTFEASRRLMNAIQSAKQRRGV
jgi:hypothetical protein